MAITSDPHDGCLHEIDPDTGMQRCYLVLPDGQRRELVKPLRRSYVHGTCGSITTMATAIAETYAVNPKFYGATFCVQCRSHFPVDQFTWYGSDELVGSS